MQLDLSRKLGSQSTLEANPQISAIEKMKQNIMAKLKQSLRDDMRRKVDEISKAKTREAQVQILDSQMSEKFLKKYKVKGSFEMPKEDVQHMFQAVNKIRNDPTRNHPKIGGKSVDEKVQSQLASVISDSDTFEETVA